MSKAFALRSSNSGPQFDGAADDVLTMQADGKCKFLPPSGGGVLPLTLELFVDGGRIGTTQDGSIANPFLTIQGGIDAIEASLFGAGSLVVAQGNYNNEELTCALDITIVASATPITVAKLGTDVAPVPGVRLVNVTVTGESHLIGGLQPTVVEGGGLLGPVSMTGEPRLHGLNATFGEVTCIDVLGTLRFRDCSVAAILGAEGGFHADSVHCWDTEITAGGIDVENAFLYVSQVAGGLTANRATLEQTTVTDGLDVANTLTADTFSLRAAREGVVANNPVPLLTNITDHTVSLGIVTVPAIEQGSFADVTVGGSGLFLKETDTVTVSLGTSGPAPRLANVGVAATWVEPDGDLVIRFFGTTAGGSQVVLISNVPSTP